MNLAAPIFVVGLNKSGTSLLYLLLARHEVLSGIAGANRLRDGPSRLYLSKYGLREGQKIEALPPKLKAKESPYIFGSPSIIHRYRLTETDVEPEDRDAVVSALRSAMVDPDRRLVEKSPPNLVRTRYLQALFPDATFIINVRDPYATISANTRLGKWGSLAEQTTHWSNSYRVLLEDRSHLRRSVMVRYEDLVANPEQSLRSILAFCGLEWDDTILRTIQVEHDLNDSLFEMLPSDAVRLISTSIDDSLFHAFGYRKKIRSCV